ncbi:metal ABC transporter permease [Pseudoroseomonas wenyumeiae]|uniref:Metal ABC transporter permease n=1 Tax=Teichococcus wenyumeiae TaxID=2478470 RepID=A0A3A9JVH7_9PROT|nr:metal ABC transporter permease [Pseudoroseomonas wenyumeiae]RKK04808.1 metal ABC transporter permease [Pseudoroseomonas wenyumeiae]RMI19476.1 metal ABC transporter permease [Pseudoroseomonas wenyumeiae]
MALLDLIWGPFAEFGFLRRAMVGCLALSLAAPPLGVFLMLRRMSLTADVLAHGILPGIAAGFLVAGLSVTAMSIGGLLAGLVVALGAGAISRATGGREDAALAALYLVALALGVTLISTRAGSVELSHLLFGSVLGVDDPALFMMAGVSSLTLVALAFAWRPLVVECFDPSFAAAARMRGGAWHMMFLGLVVLNVLAAFQALGTLMAVGLMMLPAVAARHWARNVGGMAYASVAIAIFSSAAGLLLSYHLDLPSGPAIVLVAGGAWVVSLVAGPVDGLLARWLRRPHLAG